MSDLKKVWKVFKNSSMKDKDIQKAFERAITPNACIEILEENEKLRKSIKDLLNYMWSDEYPAFKEQAIKRVKELIKE